MIREKDMTTKMVMAAALLTLLMFCMLNNGAAKQAAVANTDPSRKPVLRIETGMHTEDIIDLSVDARGRFLVTCSIDKTARVWDTATGRLLRVLRPPLGKNYA